MSDWPFNPDAVPEGLPPSRVLDLESPSEHATTLSPSGTVVLLVSGERDREWAARAAVALAAAWAGAGKRIVLADLHLEEPLLRSETESLEGIVDVFLYGASLSRIAAPGPGGAYYLIPAGTYTPDAAEIYNHPRWKKLVAGFRDTEATLLIFAPAESSDLTALSAWASEAVLLGSAADTAVEERLRRSGIGVLAVLEPTAAEAVRYAAASDAAGAAPADGAGAASPSSTTRFGGGRRARLAIGRRAPFIALVALLAIAVLGAVAYVVLTLMPDLAPANLTIGSTEAAELRAGGTPAGSREGDPLIYSVSVTAFTSLDAAREQLEIESRRSPSALFFISPEEIQGVVYHRIYAGAAADSVSASRLRDQLVTAGAIDPEDGASWNLLQTAHLAYDLGEFPTRSEALATIDSLAAVGIPSYLVAVPYSNGSRRWQVYGGAFRDSYSAEEMGRMLAAAGVPARLTLRAGTPATAME